MEKRQFNMSLYARVAFAFLILILLMVVSIATSLWQIKKTNDVTLQLVNLKMPVVQNSLVLLDGMDQSVAAMRAFLIMPDQRFKVNLESAWQEKINPSLKELQRLDALRPDLLKTSRLEEIQQNLNKLRASQLEIISFALTDKKKALELFSLRADELVFPLRTSLESLISSEDQLMASGIGQVKESFSFLTLFEWAILLITISLGLILSNRLARSITAPVIELVEASEAVAKGDLNKEVKIEGSKEIQQLSLSVRNIIDTMRSITTSAKQISEGDYSVALKPRSKEDDLLLAINNMSNILAQNKQYYEDQAWLQEGSNQILLCVAKNPELRQLCSEALAEMCRYLTVGLGALYLFDQELGVFKLCASFAYNERSSVANEFKLGEGVVGQVGLERKPILLKNIKREQQIIATGVTDEAPINTYTFPLIDKSTLVAVIELAFHEPISPLKMNYIENITPLMSGNIRICEQKEETERLLDNQRVLTEELQVQQEELKASNEELESQTEELKASEEELRVNEEEQRTLNQALEERNLRLQEQTHSLQKAQDELIAKANQIQQASKYKTEFLANMSHELRTPLNSLLILSKILSENKEKNLNTDQIESLMVIHRSGMDLLQLINDVLDLAKVEAGKLRMEITDIEVREFVGFLKDDFEGLAQEKNLKFHIEVDPLVSQNIHSDAQRLKQILKNLLSNSFKFTEKGSITLRAHLPEGEIQFKSPNLNKNNCLAFSVIDTGIGIPKEKHELVFETFFQCDGALNRKYNGTGLGLSISAQLTELLHGEIQMQSKVETGSVFTLYVPFNTEYKEVAANQEISETKPANESVLQIDLSPAPRSNKLLLIVEDDVQFSKILADVCAKKGYECTMAKNGKEAFRIANKEIPACIFLDINLPDMSGLALADQLKSNLRTKNIPIHFISGSDKSADAMQHGAASYLMKPITIEKLDLAIDSISQSINNKVSRLLVVEDDDVLRLQIQKSYEEKDIEVMGAGSGQQALDLLKAHQFDCMVLDLGLPDISGFELLEMINDNNEYSHPAVVVYTGREFSEDDHLKLQNYSKNIIIKGKVSLERLLDESALFLHQVEKKGMLHSNSSHSNLEVKSQLQGKKILLVDDDMRNTFSLAKLMNGMGVHTAIAANGKIAIDMLLKEHDFDGILMDIMMPVMDGFETIEKIRTMHNYKNLPIIALTAKAMPQDRERCLQLGATDYLAKPLDVDKLLILMRAYLCQ